MAKISQQEIDGASVEDELEAISFDFDINDETVLRDTRRSYLCGSTEDTSESITLNNGLYLNPVNSGITRAELTTTDTDLTISTSTIDEFDFIFVEANAATTPVTVTIPTHSTTTQKIITISRVGSNNVIVSGVTSQDIILSQENDSVECRQVATGGSSWAPTLSYDLIDRVPHEWTEFNEFTSGEQHSSNSRGIQNTRLFGLEGTATSLTLGTVDATGVTKTSKAFVSYDDTTADKKLQIASSEDVEIGTLVDGTETRIENYTFPNVTSPDTLTMPSNDGNVGGVLRTDGSGNIDFSDSLTSEEILDISVSDTYTLEKSVADGRNNIRIRATPESTGANYTITTEAAINAWTTLKVVYDGSNTNGTITVAPTSYIHGPTEFYLQKHGDYVILEKTNSITGNFWTFIGGQCEHNGTADQIGLYSSNMYDRLRGQSVEDTLTAALLSGGSSSSKLTKSVADLGKAHSTPFTNQEAVNIFTSALGVNVTVPEGTRSTWNSGVNNGYGIFCSGSIADPTNPNNDLGQIIISADELSPLGEVYITRSSSSGSNPRQVWAHIGDPESGGQELIPFLGEPVHTPQGSVDTVAYKVTLDDTTLPVGDLYLSFTKQYVKDITLINNDIGERVVGLESTSNEIVNSDRSALVTVGEDGGVLIASTSSSGDISTVTMAEDQFVIANSSSAPQTDQSQSADIAYTGSSKNLTLGDFTSTDLTPTSPIDPDISVNITGVNSTFTGDPTGTPELIGFAWNQSGQVGSNYTQYTISNIPAGAIVQVFFTGYVFGGDTDIRIDPYVGFTSSAVQTITMSGATPVEYDSTLLTTNATTVGVRIRGGNVTPYQSVRFEITQDFPVNVTPRSGELLGLNSTTQGFGLPKLNPDDVVSPSDGLMVQDSTDENSTRVWNGNEWSHFLMASSRQTENADLRKRSGIFSASSSSTVPTGWAYNCVILHQVFDDSPPAQEYFFQTAYRCENNANITEIATRKYQGSAWGAWVVTTSAEGITYDNTATPALEGENVQAAIVEMLNEHGGAGNVGQTTLITNVNNITANGFYSAQDAANLPNSKTFAVVNHINFSVSDAYQMAYIARSGSGNENDPEIHVRFKDDTVWGVWQPTHGRNAGEPDGVQQPTLVAYAAVDPFSMANDSTEMTYRDRGHSQMAVQNNPTDGRMQLILPTPFDNTGRYTLRVNSDYVIDQGQRSVFKWDGTSSGDMFLSHKTFDGTDWIETNYTANTNSVLQIEVWQNY